MIRGVMGALLGLVLAGGASAQTSVPVLANGGFESGALSPWFQARSFGGTTDWTISSTVSHSGQDSAFINGSLSPAINGNKELRQNFAGVATASIADLSFWVLHPTAGQSGITAFDLFYSDGTSFEDYFQTTSTSWQKASVLADLAPGKVLTGFSIFGQSIGPTYIDDVSIAVAGAVPEPASWALTIAGAGLAGVTLRRRRGRSRDRVAAV